MKKFVLAGAAALAMLAGCASGPTIRTHIDPAANLSNYKTYMFPERTGTDRGDVSTPITSYFKEAIRREMDARGYKYVENGPADLLVNFNANSTVGGAAATDLLLAAGALGGTNTLTVNGVVQHGGAPLS